MRALLAFLITIPLMANGWETSRFFIRVNGARAGEAVVREQVTAGRVETRSRSELTVNRAGTALTVSEETTELSTPDGRPISLSYRFTQPGMTLSLAVTFRDHVAIITDENGKRSVPVPAETVIGRGVELAAAALVKAGSGERKVTVFSPLARGTIQRRLAYLGIQETEHGRFHRIQVTDYLGTAELTQDTLVDETGRTVVAVNRIMGLTVETLPAAWEKGDTGGAPPDILIQTLSRSDTWFPSGFRTESLTLALTGVDRTAIPETPWQRVAETDGTVTVTITRPVLPDTARAGMNTAALKDGPIVQTTLPAVRNAAAALRRDHPADGAFAAAVMGWVYRFIDRKNYGVGFDRTEGVLASHAGDCTEHTVLAMAVLRAGGVPCRAAAGLVSINGTLGYHMWVEALLDDRWVPMDPTFHQRTADPSHLRLVTSLLNDGAFQQDLLPVMTVISRLTVRPVSAVVAGRAITDFANRPTAMGVVVGGAGFSVNLGEPVQWEAATPSGPGEVVPVGTARLAADGTTVSVAVADAKSGAEVDPLVGRMGAGFSPLSFETILGQRVALGWDGARFALLTERNGAVLRFIFHCGSDTIGEACKERAYNICLKILSDGKRTDPDR